jgi:hypothetical protein
LVVALREAFLESAGLILWIRISGEIQALRSDRQPVEHCEGGNGEDKDKKAGFARKSG